MNDLCKKKECLKALGNWPKEKKKTGRNCRKLGERWEEEPASKNLKISERAEKEKSSSPTDGKKKKRKEKGGGLQVKTNKNHKKKRDFIRKKKKKRKRPPCRPGSYRFWNIDGENQRRFEKRTEPQRGKKRKTPDRGVIQKKKKRERNNRVWVEGGGGDSSIGGGWRRFPLLKRGLKDRVEKRKKGNTTPRAGFKKGQR